MTWDVIVVGVFFLTLGCVVGSFLNVVIYRVPWQKSVLWPGSHCFSCMHPVEARDNIPILSWIFLGGACRNCGSRVSARYPMVEGLVGLLFLATYLVDVVYGPAHRDYYGGHAAAAYHALLIAFLVAATFIDYDLYILPDAITVTGMVAGLVIGGLIPEVRLDPASPQPGSLYLASSGWWVGIKGLLIGGALVWTVRIVAGLALRREAMGFGDVTLLAMIGAFLGWQAAVLTFFLAPFFGLAHAAGKLLRLIAKKLAGRQLSGTDREIPFGPYLSMAALILALGWPWIWWGWGKQLFETLGVLGRVVVTGEP